MEPNSSIPARYLCLLTLLLSTAAAAAAQDEDRYPDTAYGTESEGRGDSRGDDLPDPEASGDLGDAPQEDKDPLGFIGVGLKAGFLHFGDATYDAVVSVGGVSALENKGVPARGGFLLSLPINLGGSGFGWVFDPYLGLGEVGSYGIYTGPTITLHLLDMTYLGFGLGLRAGLITQDFWGTRTEVGMDIYGRVPLVLTHYLYEDLALLLDVGFGFGATGYRPQYTRQQLGPGVSAPQVETQFGATYQIDASAGIRLP